MSKAVQDNSFQAFSEQTTNSSLTLGAWNQAANDVLDNSQLKTVLGGVATLCYGMLEAASSKMVDMSLVIYGDTTAIATTIIATLPLLAGIAYTLRNNAIAAYTRDAVITPSSPDEAQTAQHPKVFAKATAVEQRRRHWIAVPEQRYQM